MALRLVPAKDVPKARKAGATPIAVVRADLRADPRADPRVTHLAKQLNKEVLMLCESEDAGSQLVDLPEKCAFELIPEIRPEMRSVYHIVGPSGAGKSTVAAGFARNFHELGPGNIMLITSVAGKPDPAFEKIEHTVLPVSQALEELSMEEIEQSSQGHPSLLIFDDVEGVKDAERRALQGFQQRALETGRKLGIHVLNIFHRPASGKATRASLGESNGVVFFPKANKGNLPYMLKSHFGIDPKIIPHLKDGWGHWILLRTDGIPAYILGEKRAAIFDTDQIAKALRERDAAERAIERVKAKAAITLDKDALLRRLRGVDLEDDEE